MTAYARVTLTVEIDLPDAWGPDCTVDQIQMQASRAAVEAIRRGLVIDGLVCNGATKTEARIIGAPAIKTIIVVKEGGGL